MSISTAILANSPLLYWKLDDATAPVASDSSGNSNVGVYGGIFQLLVPGPEVGSTAVRLLQAGQINTGGATPRLVKPYTMEAWVALIAPNPTNTTIVYNGNSAARGSGLVWQPLGSSANQIAPVRGGIAFGTVFGSIFDNAWHQIIFSHDAANVTVSYLDGAQQATATAQTTNAITGADKFTAGGVGAEVLYLAHVALYPAVITPAQVTTHYAANTTPQSPATVNSITPADLNSIDAKLAAILGCVRRTY